MHSSSPWILSALVVGCVMLSPIAHAETTAAVVRDPIVEGAMMCTRHFPRYEREFAIPTHLLSAIASTESGRYNRKLQIRLPWPWTVTSGGAGKYYDSKDEAVAAVKKLKASGVKNIDVGCMQVNLYHHSDAFANVEQAFDPEHNISYAATFLRRLYNEEHSWKKAASDYHSKTPALGAKYISTVYDSWFNIIEKLRAARLAVPASSLSAMNELKGGKAQLVSAKVEPYPAATKPAYAAPHMNSIKVSSVSADYTPDALSYTRRNRDNGVLVIRPDNAANSASLSPSSQGAMVITPARAAPVTLADNSYAAASVNNAAAPLPMAAPVQSLALTQNASQASATVSVPLNGLTQAALAPVTGIANAVLTQATDGVAPHMQALATPSQPTQQVGAISEYSARRVLDTASVSRKSGPNFIFSE